MACGCGSTRRTETMTSNVAQALIDAARQQSEEEYREALVASAGNAIGNANSNDQFAQPIVSTAA